MTATPSLAVRPGDGRLVRTAVAVLFVPSPDDRCHPLAAAVRAAATPQEAVDAVTDVAVSAGFAVPAFVLVALAPRPVAVVLGDVELRTDHPALPMLSGAASATWVEHTLRPHDDAVTLAVEPPSQDDDSDLVAGTVPAGGFALRLPAVADTAAAAPTTVEPVDELLEGAVDLPPVEPDPDGTVALAAVPDLEVETPDHAAGWPERTTVLVEAVHCPEGHENRPGVATCRRCGIGVAATTPTVQVARPVLGQLLLGDATAYALDRDHVFGRRPDGRDDERVVALTGSKVSRTHARVSLRGWDVVVHDLGSTNGTYVVAPGEHEPHRVEPGAPARVAPGSTVYVGDQPVRYVETPPPV